MSTSHRVIVGKCGLIKLNALSIIQSVLAELKSKPNVKITQITVDRNSMKAFNIYFEYGEEKRKLFVYESDDVYRDIEDYPIECDLYFNLNVWGSHIEIMNIVKTGIRKAVRAGGIYECVNDAIEDRFVYVLGE